MNTANRPKFNGEKIKEARELHGLTMKYLADTINVSRQSIANYETNKQIPRPEVIDALLPVLKVKWDFFMSPSMPIDDVPVFFRSLAAATSVARASEIRKLDLIKTIISIIKDF